MHYPAQLVLASPLFCKILQGSESTLGTRGRGGGSEDGHTLDLFSKLYLTQCRPRRLAAGRRAHPPALSTTDLAMYSVLPSLDVAPVDENVPSGWMAMDTQLPLYGVTGL